MRNLCGSELERKSHSAVISISTSTNETSTDNEDFSNFNWCCSYKNIHQAKKRTVEVKDSGNFASAFEGLRLSTDSILQDRFKSKCNMLPPENPVGASQRCPCGCLEQSGPVGGFRTRELSSLRLVIHGPEILNYQGTKQAPEDVAPYWKKDSRMWLWKSVRLARKRKNRISSSVSGSSTMSFISNRDERDAAAAAGGAGFE
ncbi:uncharacterized protein LOC124294774 [Neodiprion lecontei]|uniref:Uncharacterized protein LOC124294774 n=1 Tax=Neodiprion lecontei TaxID=441921 RepID=A0ABM3GBT6_NEOLC|nr:uncharacterized protein LOC124294774 [Neodiprion lecontei]